MAEHGWLSIFHPDESHVIPQNDLKPHDTSAGCWCGPTENAEYPIFVHHSMDGREDFETGKRKPS
jgi:hypothetical protein